MKKLICTLLSLVLVLGLAVTASADEVAWQLSEDCEYLTYGDQVYEWYPIAYGDILHPQVRFIYAQDVEDSVAEDSYTVVTNPDNPDMVFLCGYSGSNSPERVYVTEAGRAMLDRFCNGTYGRYGLADPGASKYADITGELVEALDKAHGEVSTVDVTRLRGHLAYEIVGYDETGTLAHPHGGVFILGNGYYYVNYDALENNYFDANGNLSYRRGEIELTKLNRELGAQLSEAIEAMELWETEYQREDREEETGLTEEQAGTIFWGLSVLMGLVIPAVPLVLGICFGRSKKSVNPQRWYLLSIVAILWILSAVGVLCLIAL